MQLDVTSREYLTLMKAVYLADYVANADAPEPSEMDWEVSRLRRKVFKHAGEAGFSDLVQHQPAADEYSETDEFAEEMEATYLRKFSDGLFWRELAARITDGLMDKKYGAEMDGWNDDRYQKAREPIQAKVERELQENGLKNLFLLGDF